MKLNEIHDFVYEGDEDYDLEPETFEVRVAIDLVTGGSAQMTLEADSKEDAITALVQVDESSVLPQIIESLESL